MEEGGGHDFFVLVVCFLEEGEGEGKEEEGRIFVVVVVLVRFSSGWLVGWLGGFWVSCLR